MAHILAVDDDHDLCALLKTALERDGHTVETRTSGTQLTDTLCRWADCILLDVMMPGEDGFAVCRRIRAETDAPILFLTARTDEPSVLTGLGIGADDYLTKPFAIEELFARIRVALKRSEAVRAASGVGGAGARAGMAGGAGVGAAAEPPAGGSAQAAVPSPATLTVGSVVLDPDRREVTVGGSPIALTAREFDVLALLMAHAETVLSR